MALKGQAKTDYQREWMSKRRLDPVFRAEERDRIRLSKRIRLSSSAKRLAGECEICGYSETTDIHHEGDGREKYILCPNHHALVTRGIKTLADILTSKETPDKPGAEDVKRKLRKAGIEFVGNRILGAPRLKSSPVPGQSSARLPLYNHLVHRAGDKVLMNVGGVLKEVVVPELDQDGQQIEGATPVVFGRLPEPVNRPVDLTQKVTMFPRPEKKRRGK